MGFWGKFLKKDTEEQQEERIPQELEEGQVEEVESVVVEEEQPIQLELEASEPKEELLETSEELTEEEVEGSPLAIEPETEEISGEQELPELEKKSEGGFWSRLFKKENKKEETETSDDEAVEETANVVEDETVTEEPEEETTHQEEIETEQVGEEQNEEIVEVAHEGEALTEEETPEETLEVEEKNEGSFWSRLFKKNDKEEEIQPQEENHEEQVPMEGLEEKEVTVEDDTAIADEMVQVEETEARTEVEEPQEEETPKTEGGFWSHLFKKEEKVEKIEEQEEVAGEAEPAADVPDVLEAPEDQAEAVFTEESPVDVGEEESEPQAPSGDETEDGSGGMFSRLKRGLTQTRHSISGKIEGLLQRTPKIDDDFYDELEDILMQADVGVETTMQLVDNIRRSVHKRKIREAEQVFEVIKEEIRAILGEEKVDVEAVTTRPAVILVVGVNGAGKTTSIAKMTWRFKKGGSKVLLAAADTFRAAAIDQLQIWADRVGVDLIKHEEGSDPGAVVFDAVQEAKKGKYDILIVDTAGRLQNKSNLMNEIAKLRKIIGREIEGAPHEVLLVLDATTGQNALSQAKQFSEVTGVTGIVLTKLDGTAKGGVVIAIANELNIPVKLIGIGEGMEDLREFSAQDFANALFGGDESFHSQDMEEENHENLD